MGRTRVTGAQGVAALSFANNDSRRASDAYLGQQPPMYAELFASLVLRLKDSTYATDVPYSPSFCKSQRMKFST